MKQDERDWPQGYRSASRATTGKALWLGVYIGSKLKGASWVPTLMGGTRGSSPLTDCFFLSEK